MESLDDFNTVHYASWHFPCYRKINCPNRHFQASAGTSENSAEENLGPLKDLKDQTAGPILRLELSNLEAGASFALLSTLTLVTLAGVIIISGSLFSNRGAKRPFNQVCVLSSQKKS